MRAPWAGVPVPGGKPLPSDSMLMSHGAMVAASNGLPRLGPSANAAPAARQRASQAAVIGALCVNMFDLPHAVDPPAGDRVEVLVQNRPDWRDRLQLTTFGDKFRAGRLHIAGLVPGAALQDCSTAVPAPGHAEAGKCLAHHRFLQRRIRPGAPAISRYNDLAVPAGAALADAAVFV